mgnify:CR=1 FL=1
MKRALEEVGGSWMPVTANVTRGLADAAFSDEECAAMCDLLSQDGAGALSPCPNFWLVLGSARTRLP